jgi:hypothetical protein
VNNRLTVNERIRRPLHFFYAVFTKTGNIARAKPMNNPNRATILVVGCGCAQFCGWSVQRSHSAPPTRLRKVCRALVIITVVVILRVAQLEFCKFAVYGLLEGATSNKQ